MAAGATGVWLVCCRDFMERLQYFPQGSVHDGLCPTRSVLFPTARCVVVVAAAASGRERWRRGGGWRGLVCSLRW